MSGQVSQSGLYGLILAAGLSSRMGGSPKALRRLGPETMLARCAEALRQGGAQSVLVVTGHEAEAVASAARDLGLECVHNPVYREGMFSSIIAGFRRIVEIRKNFPHQPPAAVFLLPVDAPLAEAWSVRALASCWFHTLSDDADAANRRVLIPCFAGRGGHPPLIGIDHVARVLEREKALSAKGGLRAYIAGLVHEAFRPDVNRGDCPSQPQVADSMDAPLSPEDGLPCLPVQVGQDVFFVPLPDAGVAGDLDRPEDCEKAEAFLALTRDRSLPSPGECLEWMRGACMGENKYRHSIYVAVGAVMLGEALARAGKRVDLPLVVAGGLLHDLVRKCVLKDKKCKAHALRAMDLLRNRGWDECALVVGAHTALPDGVLQALGIDMRDIQVLCRMAPKCPGGQEDEAVFLEPRLLPDRYAGISASIAHACMAVNLADKFFFMDRYVPMHERFDIVIERFQGDTEAISAIRHRKQVAEAVNTWLEKTAGCRAEEILPHCKENLLALAASGGGSGCDPHTALWLSFLAGLLRETEI